MNYERIEEDNRGGFNLIPQSTLGRVILASVLFAFLVDIYAMLEGLHQPVLTDNALSPKDYKSFYQVPAWGFFPVYFILVYFVVKRSWDAFNDVWPTLLDTDVVQGNVDKDALKKNKVMDDVTSAFKRWRNRWLIPLSIILGFTTMYFDSERERDIMMNAIWQQKLYDPKTHEYVETKTTLSGQVARACEAPSFMSKWLWELLSSARIDANYICSYPDKKFIKENQFTREQIYHKRVARFKEFVGKKIIDKNGKETVVDMSKLCEIKDQKDNALTSILTNDYCAPIIKQWFPVLLMHLEDGVLISFGWLIFMQCIAHAVFFWIFERLPIRAIKDKQLCIKLNSYSTLQEFGLEYWNHALNNLYWYFSAALIIPIFSRISQSDPTDLDTSQIALQFAILVLVAIPMISTVLSRQSRLPACWQELDQQNEADVKSYLSQRLWPLDKNWSSKLGVVLAFIIFSISFGISLTALL